MKPVSTTKKTIEQFNADAGLLAEFEQSDIAGKTFDYNKSVISAPDSVPDEQITAYLAKIQRGGLVQSFGCMVAVNETNFKIVAYSENCFQFLGLLRDFELRGLKALLGVDARILFTPPFGYSLAKAVVTREISMLNPVLVYSRTTLKPFHAIMHRIDDGLVIDIEPASTGDPALSLAGAVQSQKLAVKAISRLQSLPGGDIGVLCDTVVEDVQRLTGYDRVMMYRFHDDDHGEVVSEIRRSDLEPYLGIHYPATDIPQAARFLFKQNRVRIICDCNATNVKVIQSDELARPLCLVNSTLRSPHGCHTQYMSNMGSVASLVLAVIVNRNDSMKLWGLLVCHHTSPRYVPFPLRYACEFLMQAFGLQLNMELQVAAQVAEKNVLKTQVLLCDMLLRDAPFSIVTQSPNIMDLVKCDGAALYYGGKCWFLGVTPTETQLENIVNWLLHKHGDSTGFSTDSLLEAGYPGSSELGEKVCGLVAARLTSKDFLFWFRSHTANEVKWGGAKHYPQIRDDGGKMHPRSSFSTFLEVVKDKSTPWEAAEIDAIHSLQLIMRDSFHEMEENHSKAIVNVQQSDIEMKGMDELSSVACEMVRLIETATAPIFGVDSSGLIDGWNTKVAELTGLKASEAMRKSLVDEVVHEDSQEVVEQVISRALHGEEDKNVELKLKTFGPGKETQVIFMVANACITKDYMNNAKGVCFVGQDITPEKIVMDKFIRLQGDYDAIIQSVNPLIPPIFAADQNACCSEWNAAMEKLTGWMRHEVIGRVIPGEIFGSCCQLKGQNILTKFMIMLYRGISGQDTEKVPFGFFDREGKFQEVYLTTNRRIQTDGKVIGCFCFLHTVEPSAQLADEEDRQEDSQSTAKEIAYIRQEVKNPLNGIRFIHKLLETSSSSENHKQFLKTTEACERQIMTILEDMDLKSIEEGHIKLDVVEFRLGSLLDVIISQVMILLTDKNLQLLQEIPEEVKTLMVYGDQVKLQLILSDILLNVVHHAPSPNGWIEIKVTTDPRMVKNDDEDVIHVQLRMTHPGEGLPSPIIEDMFESGNRWVTQEGFALNLSRKLLIMMHGDVHYTREHSKSYFGVDLQLKTKA